MLLLLLALLSYLYWKTEQWDGYKNDFRLSPLKKKIKKQRACSRVRNLYRHKYIYGYDSDIAKRTTLYFIASGNIVDSSTYRASRKDRYSDKIPPAHTQSFENNSVLISLRESYAYPAYEKIGRSIGDILSAATTCVSYQPFVIKNSPPIRSIVRTNLLLHQTACHPTADLTQINFYFENLKKFLYILLLF